jgi:hypothetical protein
MRRIPPTPLAAAIWTVVMSKFSAGATIKVAARRARGQLSMTARLVHVPVGVWEAKGLADTVGPGPNVPVGLGEAPDRGEGLAQAMRVNRALNATSESRARPLPITRKTVSRLTSDKLRSPEFRGGRELLRIVRGQIRGWRSLLPIVRGEHGSP